MRMKQLGKQENFKQKQSVNFGNSLSYSKYKDPAEEKSEDSKFPGNQF